MTDGFTKLYSSIIHSTVWQEAPHTKILWVTMLAMSDQHGMVRASVPGLAKAAGVSLEQCLESLERLSGPDPYSRTKDHEGRRIEDVDGGWVLLNHSKYRNMCSSDNYRQQNAERQQRYRDRRVTLRNVTSRYDNVTVTPNNASSRQAEAEAEAITTTPLPPKGAKKVKKAKRTREQIILEYPENVREVVNHALDKWPARDRSDRHLNVDTALTASRVNTIMSDPAYAAITVAHFKAAINAYLASDALMLKAPQFFFSMERDGEPDPHWLCYCRLVHKQVTNG